MTSSSNINTTATNAQPDNTNPPSRTNSNADANIAPNKQDYTANAVFNNDKLSSQQMEGLTDTDELTQQINSADRDKNPENALNEQGRERKNATQSNDGSAGDQSVQNAVEQLNDSQLKGN